jgi:sugar lactone lactonase YvrE
MAGGNWQPDLQASQWSLVHTGDVRMVVSEEDDTTACMTLSNLHAMDLMRFAPRGGTSVVRDSAGNVYVASGQVYVYDAQAHPVATLEVPERPGSLAFGGRDGRTLLIGARTSLYAIRLAHAGAESSCR